jgi:hypothetical protein
MTLSVRTQDRLVIEWGRIWMVGGGLACINWDTRSSLMLGSDTP